MDNNFNKDRSVMEEERVADDEVSEGRGEEEGGENKDERSSKRDKVTPMVI